MAYAEKVGRKEFEQKPSPHHSSNDRPRTASLSSSMTNISRLSTSREKLPHVCVCARTFHCALNFNPNGASLKSNVDKCSVVG